MSKQSRRPVAPFLMLIAGVLLIAAAVISGVLLSRSPSQSPSSGEPVTGGSEQISQDEIPRVNVHEAKAALDSGEAVFVDVRPVESYELDHIPGSLSIPLNEVEARRDELDPQAWIITYCTWPAEETSARAAQIMLENGFTNVSPILGGLQAWVDAGYPIEN